MDKRLQEVNNSADSIELQCVAIEAFAHHPDMPVDLADLLWDSTSKIRKYVHSIGATIEEMQQEGEENPAIFTRNGKAEVSC